MKKYIVAATAALTIAVPAVVITTAAQAAAPTAAVTKVVQRQYAQTVGNRLKVAEEGFSLDYVKVRCAHDSGIYYSCYAKSTMTQGRTHLRYGVIINAHTINGGAGLEWRAGNADLLKSW